MFGLIPGIWTQPMESAAAVPGGFNEVDFIKTAEAGFNDPQNSYAWCITEFQGDIYVGTARNFLYRVFRAVVELGVLPDGWMYPGVTVPAGELWSPEHADDMCGEIWRYRNDVWERVYRSVPVDVSHIPGVPAGAMEPKEPGFRYMITFTDKWGEEAIYAASGASLVAGRLLLKSTDGTTWEEVVAPPAITEGDSRSMSVHNGRLYIGPAGNDLTAKLWATDDPSSTGDGTNWQLAADFTEEVPGRNVAVVSMVSLNGYLYAGTQNDEAGFQLWRSNAASPDHPQPGDWTRIIEYGAGDMASTRALTMTVFQGSLMVGTSMFPLYQEPPYLLPAKGFELLRVAADDTWEFLIGDPEAKKPPPEGAQATRTPLSGYHGGFGNVLNVYCWAMLEFDGVLYLGTFDMNSFVYYLLQGGKSAEALASLDPAIQDQAKAAGPFAGTDVWKTEDGITWKSITLNGFSNPGNYGIRTMIRTEDSLILGTANPFGGLDMLQATAPPAPQPCGTWVVSGQTDGPESLRFLVPGLLLALPVLGLILSQRRRYRRDH